MEGILYAKVQRLKEENKTLKRMKDEADAEANYQQNANNEASANFISFSKGNEYMKILILF
jgi:hypothetical protein